MISTFATLDEFTEKERLLYDNVVVLRSFSKFYGLAGIRLGWAHASTKIQELLHQYQAAFSINVVAPAVALQAVRDKKFQELVFQHNCFWRKWTAEELLALGCKVYDSQTNFICFELPSGLTTDAGTVKRVLEAKGV